LTDPGVADTKKLDTLLKQVRHPIREVYADAGYLSKMNCFYVRCAGATPYIKPTKQTKKADPARTPFNDMVRRYQAAPAAWLKRYGKRNRIESTFGAIKRRFGGRLKSLARLAIRIEACLKLVVWNLTRFTCADF
jgi:transposase